MRNADPAARRLTTSTGAPPTPGARFEFKLHWSGHLDWGKYSSNLACCQVRNSSFNNLARRSAAPIVVPHRVSLLAPSGDEIPGPQAATTAPHPRSGALRAIVRLACQYPDRERCLDGGAFRGQPDGMGTLAMTASPQTAGIAVRIPTAPTRYAASTAPTSSTAPPSPSSCTCASAVPTPTLPPAVTSSAKNRPGSLRNSASHAARTGNNL